MPDPTTNYKLLSSSIISKVNHKETRKLFIINTLNCVKRHTYTQFNNFFFHSKIFVIFLARPFIRKLNF